jgi:hypothetical protein
VFSPPPLSQEVANATFAEWLQGWGSVAAAVFSGAAVIVALLLFRHEREARAEDVAEEAARLARTIVVSGPFWEGWDSERVGYIRFSLANWGDQPVSRVSFTVHWEHAGQRTKLGPGTHDTLSALLPYQDMLADAKTPSRMVRGRFDVDTDRLQEHFRFRVGPEMIPDNVDDVSAFRAKVSFTDSTGRQWSRTNNGEPVPVKATFN